MLTEQNKAIVLQFYKAFDDRKIEQAVDLLADDFIDHLAGVPETHIFKVIASKLLQKSA